MTSEVAVMNSQAVALAADSAVTFQGYKIKYSANKIFRLSEICPVGIMAYGNANFMGVPWGTIIKVYRKKLGSKRFDDVGDYARDFLKFLENTTIFSDVLQKRMVYVLSGIIFNDVIEKIMESIREYLQENKRISEYQIKLIADSIVSGILQIVDTKDFLDNRKKTDIFGLIRKYKNQIEKAKNDTFNKVPLFIKTTKSLYRLVGTFLVKDIFHEDMVSGIVVAGFGEKNIFPKLYDFNLDFTVDDRLRYRLNNEHEITLDNSSIITYFAQGEMVNAFMEGIETHLQDVNYLTLQEIFAKIPNIIVDNLDGITKAKKAKTKRKIATKCKKLFENYKDQIELYKQVNYVSPILEVVDMLPKDELAVMAESLVNLQSLKRKVSKQYETVGGPIDVAVISKGDGFVWINRKQYFDKDLNAHLFNSTCGDKNG